MSDITITTEEWLAELERLYDEQPDGFTRAELQEIADIGRDKAQNIIRLGIATGVLKFAGHRRSVDVTGRRTLLPVYCAVGKGVEDGGEQR